MFDVTQAFSSYAVPDLAAARAFYEDTLGLDVNEEEMGPLLSVHVGGGRPLMIYLKPDHAPATHTVLNFAVDDVEAAVDALGRRGVEFERYDGFDQDDRGIMRGGGPLIAWFTDPAGNILSVVQTA
jgi:predicted enzyme related to lactoylglutathione lyase